MIEAYILKNKLAIPATFMEWAVWKSQNDTHVAQTKLGFGFWVSTVFLGLNHGFGAKLLIYETMVFHEDDGLAVEIQNAEGEHLLLMDRYETWGEAEKGHARIVDRLEKWISLLTDQKIRPTWASLETNRRRLAEQQGDTDDD